MAPKTPPLSPIEDPNADGWNTVSPDILQNADTTKWSSRYHVPLEIKFDTNETFTTEKKNFAALFDKLVTKPTTDATGTITPAKSLTELKNNTNISISQPAETLDASLTTQVLDPHNIAFKEILNRFEKDVVNQQFTTAGFGPHAKAAWLKEKYQTTQKELVAFHKNTTDSLNTWFDTHYDEIKKLYPQLEDSDPQKVADEKKNVKEELQKKIDAQYKAEMACLATLEDAWNAMNLHIKEYEASIERDILVDYASKAGISGNMVLDSDKKFTSNNRFDRYKNKYDIVDGKITVNFPEGCKKETQENMLFDRMLAFREAGNNKIHITSRRRAVSDTGQYTGEMTSELSRTKNLDKLAFRAAVKTGFELDDITFGSGYNPREDKEDRAFYYEYITEKAYGQFKTSQPNLYMFLTSSADPFKEKFAGGELSLKKGILTTYQCEQLKKIDWLKMKTVSAFTEALKNIHPDLADSFRLNKSKEDMLLRLRYEALFRNPAVTTIMRDIQTDDGAPIIDHLEEKHIRAINNIDFSDCSNRTEVVDKIKFALGKDLTKTIENALDNLVKVKLGNPLNPEKFQAGQKIAAQKKLAGSSIDSEKCLKAFKEHQAACQDNNFYMPSIDGALRLLQEAAEKIDILETIAILEVSPIATDKALASECLQLCNYDIPSKTNRIDSLEAPGHGTLTPNEQDEIARLKEEIKSGQQTINQAKMAIAIRSNPVAAQTLVDNYNELIQHAEGQIKELENLADSIKAQDGFTDPSIKETFISFFKQEREDINQVLDLLENAGKNKVDQDIVDPNSHLTDINGTKARDTFQDFRTKATELRELQDTMQHKHNLHDKIQETPKQEIEEDHNQLSIKNT